LHGFPSRDRFGSKPQQAHLVGKVCRGVVQDERVPVFCPGARCGSDELNGEGAKVLDLACVQGQVGAAMAKDILPQWPYGPEIQAWREV